MFYGIIKLQKNEILQILFILFLILNIGACSSRLKTDSNHIEDQTTQNQQIDNSHIEETRIITNLEMISEGEIEKVLIKANSPLVYSSVKQLDPIGVILYLPETEIENDKLQPIVNNFINYSIIDAINISKLGEDGETLRVAISLKHDSVYEVDRKDNNLIISFKKPVYASESKVLNNELSNVDAEYRLEPGGADISVLNDSTILNKINTQTKDNGVKIEIITENRVQDYKTFAIDNPSRIVCDLFNVKTNSDKEELISVNNQYIDTIRYYGHPDRLRVVIDIKKQYLSSFHVSHMEKGVLVEIGSDITTISNVNQSNSLSIKKDKLSLMPPVLPDANLAQIKNIEVLENRSGTDIFITTDIPVKYSLVKDNSQKIMIKFLKTRLNQHKPFPLTDFEQASVVEQVIPFKNIDDDAMIAINLRKSSPYFIEQDKNVIKFHVESSFVTIDEPKHKEIQDNFIPSIDEPNMHEIQLASVDKNVSEQKGQITETSNENIAQEKRYAGEKVAVDFYETNIKNVFRILQDVSNKNFAIDPDVAGKVTITLEKPVPWDQVLELILKMNRLGMVMEGDIIRIATVGTLEKERQDEQTRKAAEQKDREQQKALEPLLTEYIAVNYSTANDILPHINKILTKSRGSLSVDERTNQIILTDIKEVIQQAKEIVRKIDKVTPQVIIEAKIVEANTNFSRNIGTGWGIQGGIQSDDENAGIGPQRGYDALGGTYGYDMMALDFSTESVANSIGINFTRIAGTPLLLNARLTAMETQGEGKVISAPKILTLDNKAAVIKQGLEVPYTTQTTDGPHVQFKNVDLLLEVTPHVTPDDRIAIAVKITKNEISSFTGEGVPSLSTKEAQTELLINNGETIVIGGILRTALTLGEDRVPWLGEIPVLGWLFKSKSKQESKEELLIFITPRIVKLEQRAG